MPELPDVLLYTRALSRLLVGSKINNIVLRSPFVLRTFEVPLESVHDRTVTEFSRRGKRIVWHLEPELYLVIHLMIAGRFHWSEKQKLPRSKNDLLAIQTFLGTLMLTEASTKKRAGLWVLSSLSEVDAMDPGGLDLMSTSFERFQSRLALENRTLKRALTDPKKFDGIGNAYSDEILHAAHMSPLRRTHQLDIEEQMQLFQACRSTLQEWIDRLEGQNRDRFPERVTAFRPEMKVHGKFGERCPDCNAPIQRIRYVDNECNYCPGCQTQGRILADRSLSRLLNEDWPKTIEDLE